MTDSRSSGITSLNPPGLPPAPGYSQITLAQGSRLVHVSGQVGIDSAGEIAGPDHRSQAEQVMRNLLIALDSAGASINEVAKSTFFVVDYAPEVIEAVFAAWGAVVGTDPPTFAVTMVGVAALSDPRYLIEIEATAVLA